MLKVKEKDKIRLKTYKLLGYKTLVVWEKDLRDLVKVDNKIKLFIGGKTNDNRRTLYVL